MPHRDRFRHLPDHLRQIYDPEYRRQREREQRIEQVAHRLQPLVAQALEMAQRVPDMAPLAHEAGTWLRGAAVRRLPAQRIPASASRTAHRWAPLWRRLAAGAGGAVPDRALEGAALIALLVMGAATSPSGSEFREKGAAILRETSEVLQGRYPTECRVARELAGCLASWADAGTEAPGQDPSGN